MGKEGLSRTELLEDAAEEALDLVFSEEETPLQEILLEQLAKVIASSGRSVLTTLRERSGLLPNGRTVLGTLVDPLGLWRTSPLVRMNELDEKTVETTEKLVALLQKQVRDSGNPLFDLSTLSQEESMALASILARKVWERRMAVMQTSNRFVRKFLVLFAEKLERGERDSRRLPAISSSSSFESNNGEGTGRVGQTPLLQEKSHPSPSPSSRRLQEARRRLDSLQDGSDAVAVVPEVVPVKNTL